MIRINLLGLPRPRAEAVVIPPSTAATVILFTLVTAVAVAFLTATYARADRDLDANNQALAALDQQKERLHQVETQLQKLQTEFTTVEHHLAVVNQLQRNRTGGEQLLNMIAVSVVRTATLWLTSVSRKDSTLNFQDQAVNLDAVANFIAALRNSGHFVGVEIKEAREDDTIPGVSTFTFTMTAESRASAPAASSAALSTARGKS
jgi:Tfp pilus assembly protein PilN